MSRAGWATVVSVCGCVIGLGAAQAVESVPSPPCAGRPVAVQTAEGTQPSVTIWHAPATGDGWQLASCSGLAPPSNAILIEVSGRFRHDGDALSLLARIGAVSSQAGILYWSVSSTAWRPLLLEAAALAGPDPTHRRPDFR